MDGFIDLHTHSIYSDGTKTPEELVQLAAKKGINVLAITDHDEIGGFERAAKEAKKYGIRVIPGIECTAKFENEGKGSCHILGYCFNPKNRAIKQYVEKCRKRRTDKIHKILHKLQELGMRISYEEVQEFSKNGSMGRPHIAQVMVKKGYVTSIEEAFNLYLGNGKVAYVKGEYDSEKEIIHMILKAGGIPVLAHPFQMKYPTQEATVEKIKSLVKMGLKGVEAIYPQHGDDENLCLIILATALKICVTVGSDFHGDIQPNQLGVCFKNGSMLYTNIYNNLGKRFL